MGKIPAALIIIVLVTGVASIAARPMLGTVQATTPGLIMNLGTGYNVYSVDIAYAASLLLSPQNAVPAIVHELQEAMAAEQATEPQHTHDVTAGQSVHITHTIENEAVTVTIEVTVNVGEPAIVEHNTDIHPLDHGPEGPPETELPIYLPTQ